jgi:hypothetical protein
VSFSIPEIDNFLDTIGKIGSKVISLLEKKAEKHQDELDDLKKKKGELAGNDCRLAFEGDFSDRPWCFQGLF